MLTSIDLDILISYVGSVPVSHTILLIKNE